MPGDILGSQLRDPVYLDMDSGPLRIGLDCDGVIYRWGNAVRAALGARYAVDIPSDEWFSKDHVTDGQWDWLWSDEGVKTTYGQGTPFPGAVEFTHDLAEFGLIYIITATPKNARAERTSWLSRNNIAYDEVRWVDTDFSDPKFHKKMRKSKVSPICDVYIDDNVDVCLELAETTGSRVILVDHSWNRGTLNDKRLEGHPNLFRAYGLRGVLELMRNWYDSGSTEEALLKEANDAVKRETVAEEAFRLVHGPREDQYGHPHANMTATADLVTAYLRTRYAGIPVEELALKEDDAAVLMLLMKVARYAAGRHTRDTVVDMAGYAAVLARVLGLDD